MFEVSVIVESATIKPELFCGVSYMGVVQIKRSDASGLPQMKTCWTSQSSWLTIEWWSEQTSRWTVLQEGLEGPVKRNEPMRSSMDILIRGISS